MTVFLDDTAHLHPKVMAAGFEAFAFWVAALMYSKHMKTEGLIFRSALPAIYPNGEWTVEDKVRLCERLVKCGLMYHKDDAWVFHQFGGWNGDSAKAVLEQRRTNDKERQKRYRHKVAQIIRGLAPSMSELVNPLPSSNKGKWSGRSSNWIQEEPVSLSRDVTLRYPPIPDHTIPDRAAGAHAPTQDRSKDQEERPETEDPGQDGSPTVGPSSMSRGEFPHDSATSTHMVGQLSSEMPSEAVTRNVTGRSEPVTRNVTASESPLRVHAQPRSGVGAHSGPSRTRVPTPARPDDTLINEFTTIVRHHLDNQLFGEINRAAFADKLVLDIERAYRTLEDVVDGIKFAAGELESESTQPDAPQRSRADMVRFISKYIRLAPKHRRTSTTSAGGRSGRMPYHKPAERNDKASPEQVKDAIKGFLGGLNGDKK